MPSVVPSEVPYSELMALREEVLSWISRDVGLSSFLIPEDLTSTWTKEQKESWTAAVVEKYMALDESEGGVNMRKRIMANETACALRRCCMLLREGTASHRDVIKTAVVLEMLWDCVSPTLGDDETWVKCSLTFDTALISMRLAYVWMYLKAEADGKRTSFETRRAVFNECVESFFGTGAAAMDSKKDKHSGNFKELVETWREELKTYAGNDEKEFEMRIKQLEDGYSREVMVDRIDKFMGLAHMTDSWMLRMQAMDKEAAEGLWTRKGAKARGRGKGKSSAAVAEGSNGTAALENPGSSSSFEARAEDRDFEIDNEESASGDENGGSSAVGSEDGDVGSGRRGRRVGLRRISARLAKATVRGGGSKRRAAVKAQRRLSQGRAEADAEEEDEEEDEEMGEERGGMATRGKRKRRHAAREEHEAQELLSPYVERRTSRMSERRRRVAAALGGRRK